MFLSRILLDPHRAEAREALTNPNVFHGAAEMSLCTAKKDRRILWRVDHEKEELYLVLLTPKLPELYHITKQFGTEPSYAEVENYAKTLDGLKDGDALRFRLQANPVKNVMQERGKRGKVQAITTEGEQKQWLMDRSEKNGFALNENEFEVTKSEWQKFTTRSGGKHIVSLIVAVFEGQLTVKDAALFKEALTKGIGRKKAYGCGLLTVEKEEKQ